VTSIVELEGRIKSLEGLLKEKLDALEALNASATDLPALSLDDYDLNENEKHVLMLLSIGMPKSKAAQAAGMSASYTHARLRESVEFARAYSDIEKQVRKWAEARLSFTLPLAWAVIDRILTTNPEAYLGENDSYARAILKAQEMIAKQIVRLDAQKDARLTVTYELDDPLLQVKQRSLELVAEHMARLRHLEEEGQLDEMTPEWQVLDVEAKEIADVIGGQPVDYEQGKLQCLECKHWYVNLHSHIHIKHGMSVVDYKEKHGISLTHRLDFGSFMEHQAYLEAGEQEDSEHVGTARDS
jgi:hypothetical protein